MKKIVYMQFDIVIKFIKQFISTFLSEALAMNHKRAEMSPEQSFFAVFCIEALAEELQTEGDKIYKMLTECSDILDSYIVPYSDVLHTQGKEWVVGDLLELMKKRGVLE